jgi:hypothetical protein
MWQAARQRFIARNGNARPLGVGIHVGIDRERGLLRCYVVTHAAAYDGGQLGAVLDRG